MCASFFFFVACGRVFYPEFVSRAPDGRHSIAVMRNWPERDAGYRYEVVMIEDRRRRLRFTQDRPASIGLVEVSWTRDSGIARLLVCDAMEPRPRLLGFDFVRVRTLSEHEIAPVLGPQIARKYGLAPRVDAIRWACGPFGKAAYERRR